MSQWAGKALGMIACDLIHFDPSDIYLSIFPRSNKQKNKSNNRCCIWRDPKIHWNRWRALGPLLSCPFQNQNCQLQSFRLQMWQLYLQVNLIASQASHRSPKVVFPQDLKGTPQMTYCKQYKNQLIPFICLAKLSQQILKSICWKIISGTLFNHIP